MTYGWIRDYAMLCHAVLCGGHRFISSPPRNERKSRLMCCGYLTSWLMMSEMSDQMLFV